MKLPGSGSGAARSTGSYLLETSTVMGPSFPYAVGGILSLEGPSER